MFLNSVIFPRNYVFYEKICKNFGQPDRPQMTMRLMGFSCWVTNATDTHPDTEYVIIITFPLQKWLRDCASLLRYTYIVCLVRFEWSDVSWWKGLRSRNTDETGYRSFVHWLNLATQILKLQVSQWSEYCKSWRRYKLYKKLPSNTDGVSDNSQQIRNKFTTNSQQIHNKFATNSQQIHNKFTTNSQQICNKFTTNSQQIRNNFTTNSQQIRNKFTTNSQQIH
jgi:hypothetical protein